MVLPLIETNQLQVASLKKQLQDTSILPSLQDRLDVAEKYGEKKFQDFSDTEMMQWFLYQRRHLNQDNERSTRTIYEYERELLLFIDLLLTHSEAIDIDIDTILEGSLFKSLQGRHLRRYQTWLATCSPYVLRKGSYSTATLERKTTIIKAFFSFLHSVGYIPEPIHSELFIASVRKDDRPNRDLGPADVIKMLDTYRDLKNPIMFTIIHVLTTTGIRNEEFCTLRVKDLKEDSILGGYYFDVLGKGNKRRDAPLKEKVVESIRMFRLARGLQPVEKALPDEPLFTTNTGKAYSPSYLSQFVSTQITNTEELHLSDKTLRITPHIFRHAFAIISTRNGISPYIVMRSLGHEKIETTMIYLEKIFAKEQHAIHSWTSDFFGEYI